MHKKEILVSVLCMTYNHESYIRQCLEGFVMQKTDFAFEVIVHDDASTDYTADIIREYEEKYPEIIKPIYQVENQYSKQYPNYETVVEPKLKGKYIALCEGDDFWNNDRKLQMQYDAMEANPECSACFCKVKCCNEDGSENGKEFPENKTKSGLLTQRELANYLLPKAAYLFQTSGYFFSRDTFFFVSSREYGKYMNGDECSVRAVLEKGACYYIDEPLSCYRQMSKGSWNERVADKESEKERMMRIVRFYKGDLIFDQATHYIYHDLIYPRVNNYFCYSFRRIAAKESKKEIFEFLDQVDFSFYEFFKYLNKKSKGKVILKCYFPHLWKLYEEKLKERV